MPWCPQKGIGVLMWSSKPKFVRPYNRFPNRVKRYHLVRGRHLLHLTWQPFHGIRLTAEGYLSDWPMTHTSRSEEQYAMAIKKRTGDGPINLVMPGPAAASVIFGKLPLLREFLSSTTYEGGERRVPGNLRVASQGRLWDLSVQDPDAMARLTVRDESLDKALMLMETLLGVEEAPWETDRWLVTRSQEKKKK